MFKTTPPSNRLLWSAGRLTLASSILGLGVISLLTSDFIGRWQPVPPSIAAHRPLAWISALILLTCGAGLVAWRTTRVSALALALFLLLWIAVLHAPLVIAAPGDVRLWLYLGEVLAIACGALMLWATTGQERIRLAARVGFGLSLLTFGASHIASLDLVASVVPSYVPAPVVVTCLTGAAHLAAGAALLANRLPRLAAVLEAAMMSIFAVLINVPDVLLDPRHWASWITLLAEGALVGAAWTIAAALRESGPGSPAIG